MRQKPPPETTIDRVLNRSEQLANYARSFFAGYFWLIVKNVIGWLLIVVGLVLGASLPGPGGTPFFLIGFALVAFPYKRRITSHVMRGRPLKVEARIFTTITTVASLIVIGVGAWFVHNRYWQLIAWLKIDPNQTPGFIAGLIGIGFLAILVTWAVMKLSLRFVNVLLRLVPRIRRMARPFLRKWGIVLLPPPRKAARGEAQIDREQTEILEFSEGQRKRFSDYWKASKPWLKRMLTVGITAYLFYLILHPVIDNWAKIEPFVSQVRPINFVTGVVMFSVFLFVFRVFSWWSILRALGHELPVAPTTRIWSTSELARYLPGVVWQVVGRIYLVKPYGVPGAVCSTSQVLELIIFLLANVIVAVGCLSYYGIKYFDGASRWWLIALMGLLPFLFLLLLPSVFYKLMGRVLGWFKKPPLEARVPAKTLMGLLLWNIIGLIFMTFAIWLIVSGPLDLPLSKWWILGGSYCLAWCAGFLAFWAPGGLGVREIVYKALLVGLMTQKIKAGMDADGLDGFARLLAMVLRIWATAGELLLVVIAYMLDIRGALTSFSSKRPVRMPGDGFNHQGTKTPSGPG